MRHSLSAAVLVLLIPAALLAQTDAPTQTLSTNPFGAVVKWVNVEYEREIGPAATFGGSASYIFDDPHEGNAALLMRWYPQRKPLEGFYLGVRAGAYRFQTYAYDVRSYHTASTLLPGAGVEMGYNWLLGPRRNVAVGLGFGLTRIVNGGESGSVPEVLPGFRLVNVGIAF